MKDFFKSICSILGVIFLFLLVLAMFYLLVAGIYSVICFAFNLTFSWITAFAIALVLLFLKWFFCED